MTSTFVSSATAALPPLSPTAAWASFYDSITHRLDRLNNNAQQKAYLVYVTKVQDLAGPVTSLVADFLVIPVIRQARRLSGTAESHPPHATNLSTDLQTRARFDDSDGLVDDSRNSLSDAPGPSGAATNLSDSGDDVPQTHVNPTTVDFSNTMEDTSRTHNSAVAVDDYDYTTGRASLPIRQMSHENASQPRLLNAEPSPDQARDDLAQVPSPSRVPVPLPADDGMGYLRKRILSIQAQDLPAPEKAQLMHRLFVEKYAKAQLSATVRSDLLSVTERPTTPSDGLSWPQRITGGSLESLKFWQSVLGDSAPSEDFKLSEDDIKATFVPPGPDDDVNDRPLGCQHYMRNVKLQCSTCQRWYTCRFCHNEVEDHELIRKDTKNMLCMYCGTAQKAGEVCMTCGVSAARYYCAVCKLWNNDPDKNVYHCDDCGICRVGRGIGKDFFHCKRCVACIAISTVHDHKCFERATDCDCPICGEYMFTSPKPVVFMKCGHSIHRNCFDDYMHTSYKCPICNKSVVNMEIQFRNLDLAIQAQPMPPELRDTQAVVLCNDCSAKSSVQYHWLGLKCGVCQSYNTAQLQIMGTNDSAPAPVPTESVTTISTTTAGSTVIFADVIGASPMDIPSSRDVTRRRRHSSSYNGPPMTETETDRLVQSRFARSESPRTFASRPLHRNPHLDIEEDDEEDMLGLWSRIPRSITSDDEAGGQDAPEDSEEEESEEDTDDDETLEDDDDDHDDENDGTRLGFFMPGHR
ncbi:hypothetical protein Micbo1qcDRAFT_130095 [Microdochium bolleyi]|uniref:CHY zinc finger-domain-containing protein n=1 Tax=Microdochium bolleyi TaxID=196109 RepID=A0A136JJ69_9PEZI|nr:hypothetical protein Micbo1qcDRAFT_130095 [Microdochium bolleyi]